MSDSPAWVARPPRLSATAATAGDVIGAGPVSQMTAPRIITVVTTTRMERRSSGRPPIMTPIVTPNINDTIQTVGETGISPILTEDRPFPDGIGDLVGMTLRD